MFSPISFSSHFRDLSSLGSGIIGALRSTDRHKQTAHSGENSRHISFLLILSFLLDALAMKSGKILPVSFTMSAFPLSVCLHITTRGLHRLSWHMMDDIWESLTELCWPFQLLFKSDNNNNDNWHTATKPTSVSTWISSVTRLHNYRAEKYFEWT
jgi:hypothetical protein